MKKWLVMCVIALSGCASAEQPRSSLTRAATTADPTPLEIAPPAVSAKGLPLADLEIKRGDRVLLQLEVEIAETPASRYQGLRQVEKLEAGKGMAFLFQSPSRGSFTMQDTLIPLDIAFWDQNNLIVDILEMTPCRSKPCPAYTPQSDYVGAVEMNQGVLRTSEAAVGDRVETTRRSAQIPTKG